MTRKTIISCLKIWDKFAKKYFTECLYPEAMKLWEKLLKCCSIPKSKAFAVLKLEFKKDGKDATFEQVAL